MAFLFLIYEHPHATQFIFIFLLICLLFQLGKWAEESVTRLKESEIDRAREICVCQFLLYYQFFPTHSNYSILYMVCSGSRSKRDVFFGCCCYQANESIAIKCATSFLAELVGYFALNLHSTVLQCIKFHFASSAVGFSFINAIFVIVSGFSHMCSNIFPFFSPLFFLQCEAISGLGFRRGSYKCICRKGYYFPDTTLPQKYFNGSTLEEEYEKLMLVRFLWASICSIIFIHSIQFRLVWSAVLQPNDLYIFICRYFIAVTCAILNYFSQWHNLYLCITINIRDNLYKCVCLCEWMWLYVLISLLFMER